MQVESEKSQERLQQDLAVLAQLTLPQEYQFQLHYWKELPLGPWPISWDNYVDVVFNVQSKYFFCHKVCIIHPFGNELPGKLNNREELNILEVEIMQEAA